MNAKKSKKQKNKNNCHYGEYRWFEHLLYFSTSHLQEVTKDMWHREEESHILQSYLYLNRKVSDTSLSPPSLVSGDSMNRLLLILVLLLLINQNFQCPFSTNFSINWMKFSVLLQPVHLGFFF